MHAHASLVIVGLMSSGLRVLMQASGGVFTRVDALQAGHTDRELRTWVQRGKIRRLRRGVFAIGPPPAYPSQRLLEQARGIARLHGDEVAISHHAALALHDIAVHDVPLDVVHAVRLRGGAQSAPGLRVVRPRTPPPTTRVGGVLTVTPEVAVIQVAGAFGIQAGVVAADSAMHRQLVVPSGLKAEVERAGRMHGLGAAQVAARRSRTGAESPGESLLRLVAEDLGYDVELQFPVAGPDGMPFAYADLRLTGTRSLLEFDGAIKYEGACGRQALVAEKEREDRIRRLGWGLERVIWSDFERPLELNTRIVEAARRTG